MIEYILGTLDLSGDSYVSCSQTYVTFETLITHLEGSSDDDRFSFIEQTMTSVKEVIVPYFDLIKETSIICCMLDPRVKNQLFDDIRLSSDNVKQLEALYKTYPSNNDEEDTQESQN